MPATVRATPAKHRQAHGFAHIERRLIALPSRNTHASRPKVNHPHPGLTNHISSAMNGSEIARLSAENSHKKSNIDETMLLFLRIRKES